MRIWLSMILAMLLVLQPFATTGLAYATDGTSSVTSEETAEQTTTGETGENSVTQPETPEPALETSPSEITSPEANQEETTQEEPVTKEETTEEEPISKEGEQNVSPSMKMLAPSNAVTDDKIMVITENILDSSEIKTFNGKDEVNEATINTDVEITYQWSIPDGHKYTDGSTFSFQIPEELKVYDVIKDQPLKFEGTSLGTFNVDLAGNATVTFNENVNKFSKINGTLQVLTQIKETVAISEEKTITVTPIVGKESKEIRVALQNPGKDITKKGVPNRAYNAESITWSIELNKGLKEIKDAVWTDVLPAGLKLIPNSFKIERLVLKMDGTVDREENVTGKYLLDTANGLRVDFGTMTNAYLVSFDTTIEDEEVPSFENKTDLTGSGFPKAPASATVAIGRGVELAKKASDYDDATQTITWTADINYRQRELNSLLVTDDFTDTHELQDLKLYEIELDADGKESKRTEIAVTPNPRAGAETNGFTLTLPKNKTAYQLVYKTQASERLLGSGKVDNMISVDNRTDKATQAVGQSVVRKTHDAPNYADETIDWKIELNRDEKEMKNVVLTDIFTNKGLTFIAGSLKVSGMAESDYTLTSSADGFILTFNKTVKDTHMITYQTKFDYRERKDQVKEYLENEASVVWKDTTDTDRQAITTDRVTLSSYSQNNGFKGGSYNAITKEITWTIGVNYHEYPTNALTVTDTWQDEQSMVESSFEVFELIRGKGGDEYTASAAVPPSDYAVDFQNGKFILTFKKATTHAYVITYKTSIDNTFIQKTYKNEALVTDDKAPLGDLKASVSVQYGGEYTDKSGLQNGKLITWTVKLNYGQSTLRNVSVTDIPSNNQDVLLDSVKVYETNVAANGTVLRGDLLSKDAYTLTEDEVMGKFTLAFKNEIDRPYILEYDSFIVAAVGAPITNDVMFEAESLSEGVTTKQSTITVKRTSGMGTASGETGTLTIKKTDESGALTLAGAKFELIDKESNRTVRSGTTDAEGILTFSRLLYGDYVLRETSPPVGYLIAQADQNITISKLESSESIKNNKIRQDVTLIKKSEQNDATLAGAEFNLCDANGVVLRTNLVTDANGSLTVKDLEPGTYYFVETKAPIGHLLDSKKHDFTIVKDQLTAKIVTVTNQTFKSVRITKVDDVTQAPLANTTFKLVDANNQTLRENLKTDANGILLIENLDLGDYRLVETQASDGYILLGGGTPFSITLASPVIQEVKIMNEKQKEVRLTKVDNQTKLPLKDAEFSLYDSANNEIRRGLVTGTDGTLLVTKLNPGTYHFVETKAPDGYLLDTTRRDVTVTTGQRTPSLITVENERKKSVRLIKTDAMTGRPLADAVFSLLDGTGNILQTNLKTDVNGELFVSNLLPGNYRFIETNAPGGYMTDGTPYPFTLVRGNNDTAIVRATNDTFKSVRLMKVDNLSSMRLIGAEFSLVNASGTILRTGLVTDVNGEIYVSGLVPGEYAFVETKAPSGYLLDSKRHTFTVSSRQSVATTLTVTNEQKKSVRLVKTDATTSKPLAGTEFMLRTAAGEVVKEKLMTDTNGEIYVNGLLPGDYAFIETKAVNGYILDATPRTFTLPTGTNEVIQLTMTNDTFKSIRLVKKDGADGKLLADATFRLLDANGKVMRENLVTDASGEVAVTGLVPGEYTFIETQAPQGYELDRTPHVVTIKKNQSKIEELVVLNERLKTLIVQKVDEDSGEALKDAEFVLTDADGKRIARLKTDESGESRVPNLSSGEYTLVETKAPTGYLLSQTPRVIRLEKNGEAVIRITVMNTIDPDYEFEDNDTPGGSGNPKDPQDPKDPQGPKESHDPKTPSQPSDGTDTPNDYGTKASQNGGLPQTGETEPFNSSLLGILLAACGILLLFLGRRKTI